MSDPANPAVRPSLQPQCSRNESYGASQYTSSQLTPSDPGCASAKHNVQASQDVDDVACPTWSGSLSIPKDIKHQFPVQQCVSQHRPCSPDLSYSKGLSGPTAKKMLALQTQEALVPYGSSGYQTTHVFVQGGFQNSQYVYDHRDHAAPYAAVSGQMLNAHSVPLPIAMHGIYNWSSTTHPYSASNDVNELDMRKNDQIHIPERSSLRLASRRGNDDPHLLNDEVVLDKGNCEDFRSVNDWDHEQQNTENWDGGVGPLAKAVPSKSASIANECPETLELSAVVDLISPDVSRTGQNNYSDSPVHPALHDVFGSPTTWTLGSAPLTRASQSTHTEREDKYSISMPYNDQSNDKQMNNVYQGTKRTTPNDGHDSGPEHEERRRPFARMAKRKSGDQRKELSHTSIRSGDQNTDRFCGAQFVHAEKAVSRIDILPPSCRRTKSEFLPPGDRPQDAGGVGIPFGAIRQSVSPTTLSKNNAQPQRERKRMSFDDDSDDFEDLKRPRSVRTKTTRKRSRSLQQLADIKPERALRGGRKPSRIHKEHPESSASLPARLASRVKAIDWSDDEEVFMMTSGKDCRSQDNTDKNDGDYSPGLTNGQRRVKSKKATKIVLRRSGASNNFPAKICNDVSPPRRSRRQVEKAGIPNATEIAHESPAKVSKRVTEGDLVIDGEDTDDDMTNPSQGGSQPMAIRVLAIKERKKKKSSYPDHMRKKMSPEELGTLRLAFVKHYPPPPSNMQAQGRYEHTYGSEMSKKMIKNLWQKELKPWSERWWRWYTLFNDLAREKKLHKPLHLKPTVTEKDAASWAQDFYDKHGDARPPSSEQHSNGARENTRAQS